MSGQQSAAPAAAPAPADQSNSSNAAGGTLPQTASPLPLLGLLGFGSVVAGVASRRRK
jgi:LPXTG-motif cell wall-anchored protein